jgi:phosphoglycerol transferase MdoB-like AlkP superfamily enzyme
VKGRFRNPTLHPGNAFWSSNLVTGYLTLNSSFTVLKSLSQPIVPNYRLLPPDQAAAEVTTMLCQKNEQMLDPHYPFLRQKSFPDNPKKLNLVIIIMESWNADNVGSISGRQSFTPFFDNLATNGMLFTNFLANGYRSAQAVSAIIDSIPDFYAKPRLGVREVSFMAHQSEASNYIALGNILSKQGYTTAFHHGAPRGTLAFDAHTRLSGFLNYYSKEDYLNLVKSDEAVDPLWGIWDEEFFQDALLRIDGFKYPFCSVIFSLTPHEPFTIPAYREKLFQSYSSESKLQQCLRYSDYSLQQFFLTAQNKPWFMNTIFIITADHTSFSQRNNFYSSKHIPLLLYAPSLITPQRCNKVGSQVDILPTVLDLLHISTIHNSMGSSLLDPKHSNYAVMNDGGIYAIFNDQFVLIDNLEKNGELYDYYIDPFLKNDLKIKYPQIAQKLKYCLYAYIQSTSYAIRSDKICRPDDLK